MIKRGGEKYFIFLNRLFFQKRGDSHMAKKRKVSKAKTCETTSCPSSCMSWLLTSEVALYFFFYYLLYVMQVQANYWLGSLVLWALINVTLWCCPLMRMHHNNKCC